MLPLLPDAEVLLVHFLAAHPDLVLLHDGNVATQLPGDRPAIRVTRLPGPMTGPEEDTPELQVECWAVEQDEASVLARSVIAVIEDVKGGHEEGVVAGVDITLGPTFAPDPDTDEPRYLLRVGLLTYPPN